MSVKSSLKGQSYPRFAPIYKKETKKKKRLFNYGLRAKFCGEGGRPEKPGHRQDAGDRERHKTERDQVATVR